MKKERKCRRYEDEKQTKMRKKEEEEKGQIPAARP